METQPSHARPGVRNRITHILGLQVGQAQDVAARTGVTVILPDERAVCAVDVRGGAPGTRETDALAPENLVEAVDAVVLSGGSVYGLAAADGVAAWLGARGRGYGLSTIPGVPVSPVVPAAILFDLANGGDKAWGEAPPYRALGMAAVAAAGETFELGTAGAGFGAMAGLLKGGIGSASVVSSDGMTVGAIVAVNSFGAVTAPGGRTFWAGPYEIAGELAVRGLAGLSAAPEDWGLSKAPGSARNTTIACVAPDVALTPAQAKRVATATQDGFAPPSARSTRRSTGMWSSRSRRPMLRTTRTTRWPAWARWPPTAWKVCRRPVADSPCPAACAPPDPRLGSAPSPSGGARP